MTKEEVLKLAKLARIEIPESEAESLTNEFESIIKYVSEVKNLERSTQSNSDYAIKNVLREDGSAHEGGVYSEDLLKGAPKRDGDYISVKKIL